MSQSINQPQQSRSQKTMNRMLEAAEAMLEDKTWAELTIQDVVQEAGCSVGAFYGRFKDKNGLLHALDERYFDRLTAMIELTLDENDWSALPFDDAALHIAELVVDLHHQSPGLMRTLILQSRLDSDPRFREREDRLTAQMPRLVTLLMAHRDEIMHDDPVRAIQFGLLQLFYTARELTIWPHLAKNFPFPKGEMPRHLVRGFIGYLRTP